MAIAVHERNFAREKLQWAQARAQMAYWFWQIATKVVLGLIYVSVIAEGLRFVVPALGKKLYRLPGLAWLYDFEDTHQLDLANLFSVFMLVAVWYLWGRILELWLGIDWECDDRQRNAEDHHKFLVVVLGTVLLVADSLLFYVSMAQLSWGGSLFSASALIATVAYLAVLIFCSYIAVMLHLRIPPH